MSQDIDFDWKAAKCTRIARAEWDFGSGEAPGRNDVGMLDLESKRTERSEGNRLQKTSNRKVGDCDDSLTERNQV